MPDNVELSPVEIVLAELSRAIEKNGQMPVAEWRKTQGRALQVLIDLIAPLPAKVERLERKNLLMLMEKHPKATAASFAAFFLVLELWHSAAWRPWLSKLFGIPIP